MATPPDREIGSKTTVVVIAGVSGSGKSTIGKELAAALGWSYAEADDFHPPANIEKMSRGLPLTDGDRAPWLAKIAAFIADKCVRGEHAVVSCSALKRAYRDTLVGDHAGEVRIVLLDGTEAEIAARLAARKGHFMPPALLHSQFTTLERPGADEGALAVPISGSPAETVARIVAALRAL